MASNFRDHDSVFPNSCTGGETDSPELPGAASCLAEDDNELQVTVAVAKKVIIMLTSDIVRVLQYEIGGVLDKAYSQGLIGEGVHKKGVKDDSKQVAREFLDAACSQFTLDYGKFDIFLAIFREYSSLESIATRIENEMKKLSRSKSWEGKEELRKATLRQESGPPSVFDQSFSTGMAEFPSSKPPSTTPTEYESKQFVHTKQKFDTKFSRHDVLVGINAVDMHKDASVLSIKPVQCCNIAEEPIFVIKSAGPGSYDKHQRLLLDEIKNELLEGQNNELHQNAEGRDMERNNLEMELQKKNKVLEKYEKDISEQHREMDEMKLDFKKKIESLRQEHDDNMRRLEEAHEKIEKEHYQQKSMEVQDIRNRMEQQRSTADLEMERLQNMHLKEIEEEKVKHRKKETELREKYKRKITCLKEVLEKKEQEAIGLKLTIQKLEMKLEYEKKLNDSELEKKDREKRSELEKMELENKLVEKDAMIRETAKEADSRLQIQNLHHQLEIQETIHTKEKEALVLRYECERRELLSMSSSSVKVSFERRTTEVNMTQTTDALHDVPELHKHSDDDTDHLNIL